jgi:threonine/homoserine/homoserine lactone efflux protein
LPELRTIAVFMVAALALNLTPGPDMLYVVARAGSEGRAAGVASALGIAAGCLVHTLALAAGLSALLVAIPAAYEVVRYAGAAYLVYLGVRALAGRGAEKPTAPPAPTPMAAVFRQGVLTNVLNPKVALFFLALLPQFVDPRRGSAALQIVVLGLLFNISGTLVNLAVAALASRATGFLRERERGVRAVQRLAGAVFLGLGARLVMAGRR